jgi:hypothetical protein
MRYAILSTFLLIGALSAHASEPAVKVKVSAAFTHAPGNVVVKAIVVPDERNQLLTITAESTDYLRRSTVQLAGKDEARVHELSLVSLPEGEYVVSAQLVGRDGSNQRAETTLRVFGGTRRLKR